MTRINWSDFTDFGQLPALANTASGGSFWVAVLYLLWIIALMGLISYGFITALTTASFLALVAGLIMVYAELIAFKYVLVFIGIILFMFLYIMFVDRNKA